MRSHDGLSLLSEAKSVLGFENDSELSAWLGLSKASLSNVRTQRAELSSVHKLKILQALGGDLTEQDFLSLVPKTTRNQVLKEEIDVFDPARGKDVVGDSSFWVECIDRCMKEFEVQTDAEFSRYMGISDSLIASVRTGDRELNLAAKFKILDKLGYTASRNLLSNLLPVGLRKSFLEVDKTRFRRRNPLASKSRSKRK